MGAGLRRVHCRRIEDPWGPALLRMRDRLGDDSFFAWQRGYGVFSLSSSQLPTVREYVRHQKEHHQETSTKDEFQNLLEEHGLVTDAP